MKRPLTVISIFAVLCVMSTAALGAQTTELKTVALAQTTELKKFTVKFDIDAKNGVVTTKSDNKGCLKGKGKKAGCIRFLVGTIGLINFSLDNGNQGVMYCSEETKPKWVISKVELSDQGYLVTAEDPDDPPVVSDKGIFGGNLPDWLKNSFPQVNQNTGILYEVPTPQMGMTQVTGLNLNNNNATLGVEDIWYRVTVASCNADSDVVLLVSDPRFENDGSEPD